MITCGLAVPSIVHDELVLGSTAGFSNANSSTYVINGKSCARTGRFQGDGDLLTRLTAMGTIESTNTTTDIGRFRLSAYARSAENPSPRGTCTRRFVSRELGQWGPVWITYRPKASIALFL